MIVSINQPAYLPWLGYFDRILKSDIHVVLDHVQFEKNSVVNRNKLRTSQGWMWLTVPIKQKGRFGNLDIRNLEIDEGNPWQKKHVSSLSQNYSKAPHFNSHFDALESCLSVPRTGFFPLVSELTAYLLGVLDIPTQIVFSSDFQPSATKSDLVLEICKQVGASKYISGPFGRSYLDRDAFASADIDVWFHDYSHPKYSQAHSGFEPYMSVVDLIFNHGPASRGILENSPECLSSE